jgi:hypothetical protein
MAEQFVARVGEEITVELRNSSAVDRRMFPGNDTITYSGTVLPGAPYDPPESFRMSGNDQMPVRVISLRHVIGANGKKVQKTHSAPQATLLTFPVKGSKGADYTVTIDSKGHGSCTCSGFGYRRKCSHIDGVFAGMKK